MIKTIFEHRSVRSYKPDPVDEALLQRILEAGTRASNTGNMQIYSIIVTTDPQIREQLSPCHFGQPMVTQAPIVLTFCVDVRRFSLWCRQRGADPQYDNFVWFVNGAIDAILASQNVCLEAESEGLGICYLGTTIYTAAEISRVLSLPKGVIPVTTVVTGYLANVDWHLPFLVYTLPGISLALSFLLKRQRSFPEPEQSIQLRHKMIDRRKLAGLMVFYFFVTYAVLVVTFYASFLIDDYKIDSSFSGVLISLFFLAIMLPGLFIDKIIRSLKRNVNLVALVLVCVGLLCVGVFHGKAMLAFGALCTGLGYGIMQPVIYDKAATIAPPRSATLALSFVMSVNYLAVMVCPFIVDLFRHVFGTHSDRFPFFFNAALVLAVAVGTLLRRGSFTLGLDESYYRN